MKSWLAICSVPLLLLILQAQLALAGEPVWIDVRTADEFKQQHLPGAVNIPYEEIDAGIAKLGVERDTVIYLYCRSGRRSGIAKESLNALGYTGVVNIGGLEDALVEAAKTAP